MNGTEEAAGATGIAIKPAPPSQGAEAKGEETPKKKKTFSFKKPSKLSGLSFKRNRKEGAGGDPSASSPTEEGEEQGVSVPAVRKALPREGRLPPPLRARSPRPKGQRLVLPPREEETQKRQGPRRRAIHSLRAREWPYTSERAE